VAKLVTADFLDFKVPLVKLDEMVTLDLLVNLDEMVTLDPMVVLV
jgi:hypothetical protein